MRAWRLLTAVVLSFGIILPGLFLRADDSQAKVSEQIWEGKLKIRPGFEVLLVVRAELDLHKPPVATLDSPDEGLSGLKLSSVVIDDSHFAFELKVTAAKFDGKMNEARTEATGTWTQRGAALPLSFVKKDKATPQPKPVGPEQIWEGKIDTGGGSQA